MALPQLTAAVERLTLDVEAAPPGDHPLLVQRCRDLRQVAHWDSFTPGKVPRLLDWAANALELAGDPAEAAKSLRTALGALRERAKRMPAHTPVPAA
jgi:hypothetical protein